MRERTYYIILQESDSSVLGALECTNFYDSKKEAEEEAKTMEEAYKIASVTIKVPAKWCPTLPTEDIEWEG